MANNKYRADGSWNDGRAPRLLQSDTALVAWLFMQLDASQPKLPVPNKIRQIVDEFCHDLFRNGYFDFPIRASGEILCSIYTFPRAHSAEHCGLRLLQFVGRFSDAMVLTEANPKVPLVHIARMMLSIGEKEFRGIGATADKKWIKSTREFEQKFGVRVKVRIPKKHRYEFVWDLTDIAYPPNE